MQRQFHQMLPTDFLSRPRTRTITSPCAMDGTVMSSYQPVKNPLWTRNLFEIRGSQWMPQGIGRPKVRSNICRTLLYLRTPPCALGTIPPKVRSRNAGHTTARSKFLKNRLCLLNQSFTYHLHMQASDVAVNNWFNRFKIYYFSKNFSFCLRMCIFCSTFASHSV